MVKPAHKPICKPLHKPVNKSGQCGFTLLEVIVAMALTGFVLGSLFTLVGGSKQLSWRSEASLLEAMKLRATTNFALLQNEYSDVEPILEEDRLITVAVELLEEPERKTQPSPYTLERFEVLNQATSESITGVRWIRLETAQ